MYPMGRKVMGTQVDVPELDVTGGWGSESARWARFIPVNPDPGSALGREQEPSGSIKVQGAAVASMRHLQEVCVCHPEQAAGLHLCFPSHQPPGVDTGAW